MLYPVGNVYRTVYHLNGIWNFKRVSDDFEPLSACTGGRPMPVPASMNDITTDKTLRDYIGKVLYEREFSMSIDKNKEYRLRIGATSHKCKIYLNGKFVADGINGFYPIDVELKGLQSKNRLSVVIDNRLDFQTFPPGIIEDGRQTINFDFFNFTGIHRDVCVYTLPDKRIDDIVIRTVVDGNYGKIEVELETNCETAEFIVLDQSGNEVARSKKNIFEIDSPVLWSTETPYLYTLVVKTESDEYEEKFGIRKITYDKNGLYLNDKPVYLKGFGMHEDFTVLGKGNNAAVNVRDFELLKWIGANSIRTSHYPYSEEIMSLADRYGILVIDEVPAVGMNAFRGEGNFTPNRLNEKTKALHKELIKQLLKRDKNHPCLVMLSVANEPATEENAARDYFKDVISYAKMLTDLPVMIAEVTKFRQESKVADLVDFTALNRYYGWYEEHGNLYKTEEMLNDEIYKWHEKYGKPIIITEFGADTLEGVHTLPSEAFSEEYQREFLEENCRVFDTIPFVVGEHVWNFADFKTKQGVIRVRGNRKGVFTRERQPKMAAYFLRDRWKNKIEK